MSSINTVIEARAQKKFGNLTKMAEALGYSLPAVHQVVAGYRKPWPKIKRRISEALEVPEEELFQANGWPKKEVY
ncbi:transcriptional regulator [Sporotomaculum syntrophicum]|uniref:transcriptional regulator n=1 Tax=Sporotomaculum syntrophicum TaxID=182264 RepID=UPI001379863C|nr:transcriptional regulator [Sporotomaculum syntrophicum]